MIVIDDNDINILQAKLFNSNNDNNDSKLIINNIMGGNVNSHNI